MNNYNVQSGEKVLQRILVVGSGSWATALVKIFSDSGNFVSWLVRDHEQAAYIQANGRNPRYLSFAELNTSLITASANAADLLQHADAVIFAVPAAYLQETVQLIQPDLLAGKKLLVSIKGFVPGSGYVPSVYISKQLNPSSAVTVLSGPCHAEEVAAKGSTFVTVAGADTVFIQQLCSSISSAHIHTIPNNDATGVEYVSILKNIVGIATGIARGLNYGANFEAVLVSNAMREIQDFLNAVDPKTRCLYDSVYFGDLLVTAYSDFSRNRTLGKMVGRGIQITKALDAMEMVAEGYYASRELPAVTKGLSVSLPVVNSVYRILHQHANPFHEFKLVEKQLR